MYIPRDANITEHEFQLFRISIGAGINSGHTVAISSLISNNERAVNRDRSKRNSSIVTRYSFVRGKPFKLFPDNTLHSLYSLIDSPLSDSTEYFEYAF